MVCVKWRVFSKRQLILTKFNRPGNLKEVTGFEQQTELYPYKCRSKSPTSSTLPFHRLSNSNVKVRTICLGLWYLCYQQVEHQLTALVRYFDDEVLGQMRLLPTIADSGTLISYTCRLYMWSERKAIRLIVNFFVSYKETT